MLSKIYSFSDYEEAYYHQRFHDCRKIGLYLLKYIKNERARELEKELSEIEYQWDLPQSELEHISKVLLDVKVWIMVHQC